MPPIRISVEEFVELLKQGSDDEEPSEPPTEQSVESLLLSRVTTLAVQLNDPGLILGVLRTADELDMSIILEPRCRNLLQTSTISTN